VSSAKQKSRPIYIFTHEFFPKKAGISICVQEMAKSLAGFGREVTVFAPKHSAFKTHLFPYSTVPLNNRGTHGWGCRIVTMREMMRYKDKIAKGVLCLPEPGPILAFMYLRLFKRIQPQKLILILHGSEILRFGKSRLLKCLFRSLLRDTDRILLFSKYCEKTLCDYFPEASGRTVVAPGALRSEFVPIPPRDTHLMSNTVKLLTVARLHPRKGQMQVLEAINAMPSALKEKVVYQIAGPIVKAAYFEQIKQYAQTHHINIAYLGEVPEEALPRCYHEADIFVMASIPYQNSIEGFGLSYLEASASGLPVVGYDSGGVSDAVLDNKTGFLAPVGGVDELSKMLTRLIEQPELRKRMGKAGITFAKQCSWIKNAKITFED